MKAAVLMIAEDRRLKKTGARHPEAVGPQISERQWGPVHGNDEAVNAPRRDSADLWRIIVE
jgi:hypothetical protein